jgi:predicted permease
MGNMVLLIVCFLAGVSLRKSGRFTDDAHVAINAVIVNLSLPSMALLYLHDLKWELSVLPAIAMPWALFIYAALIFVWMGKKFNWSRETTGALILVAGLGNTSFVGLPMIEALYGKAGMGLGLAIDQCGSYLVLSTLGLFVATQAAGGCNSASTVVKRIITFPPFIALVIALLLIPVPYPNAISTMLQRLADTVAPLALLSVGIQLRLTAFKENVGPLSAGLGYKLIICPILVLVSYFVVGHPIGYAEKIVILEAAMGPMIGASIVATHYSLNNRLVTMMVGIGIPGCLISAPLIMMLLR